MKTFRQILSFCFLLLLANQLTLAKNTYKIEKIISGFSHPEAILWVDANPPYLLFSDIIDQKIYKLSENNKVEMFLDNVGKCNGIIQDNDANLIISQENNRQISILKNNVLESMISTFKNKKLNGPFGLGIKKTTNTLYFTDPNYGINSSQEELAYYGIYAYQTSKKVMTLLIDSIVKPKYLAFSPDEWFMYVSNSENNKIYKIEMKNDTSVRKVSIFASFNSKINGLQCNLDGNIYVANANEGIKIFSFNGNLIDQITIADTVRNFTFASNKIIYATATDGIYKITINPENPFIMNEYLGRVSDKSITINMMSESDGALIVDYGLDKQNLNFSTQEMPFSANVPIEIVLNNLESNSNYYYRVRYKTNTNQNYIEREVRSFKTQKSKNSDFNFVVNADPHLDLSSNYITYSKALENTLQANADFMIDLGDNFMSDKLPVISYENIKKRMFLFRHFYDKISHSVPIYLVLGNHEAESGWELDGTNENVAVWNTLGRKLYFPNPLPDAFYSGASSDQAIVGKRESYYSWTWGDALFVVIDPYWFTVNKPSKTNNSWDWTLGKEQYDWLKSTLENSKAKFKFVFSHQIVGGSKDGRGGIEQANYYEMGGKNDDGTYAFDIQRPGWGKPIHRLFVENGVSIFFHGHDHLFIKQELDGVIYQLVPQPSLYNYTGISQAKEYGYSGVVLPNSGHLKVSVNADSAIVEYIRAFHEDDTKKNDINGKIEYTYSILPKVSNVDIVDTEQNNLTLVLNPNPCTNNVSIEVNIKQGNEYKIAIYNIEGVEVKTFTNLEQIDNKIKIQWDCLDQNNKELPSGNYICNLIGKTEFYSCKFSIIK